LPSVSGVVDAHVLLNLGDSVTTDHISPAGSIARNSCAAKYLIARQYVSEFNLSMSQTKMWSANGRVLGPKWENVECNFDRLTHWPL